MRNTDSLADYIVSIRQRYARSLASDLARLRAEYGGRRVQEALQIARQIELRHSMSISGSRRRQHDARQDEHTTQAAFQRNKLWR
ncbi:MAG: hypothetical protein WB677_19585 [Xanthobacteraceae bacterium]